MRVHQKRSDFTLGEFSIGEMARKEVRDLSHLEKFGIVPELDAHVDQTLRDLALRRISGPDGIYPTPSQWVAHLEELGQLPGWRRFYPCFVQNEAGDVYFAKLRFTTNDQDWGGLAAEYRVLHGLDGRLGVPRAIVYAPADYQAGRLETLVAEAIPFQFGCLLPLEQWTPAAAGALARTIGELASIPLQDISSVTEEPVISVVDLVKACEYWLSKEQQFAELVQRVVSDNPLPPTVVTHGDPWVKNVVVSRSAPVEIKLVDWERGGPGYAGQDIGRVFWEHAAHVDPGVCEEAIRAYLAGGDTQNLSRAQFGIIFEALRWIEDRRVGFEQGGALRETMEAENRMVAAKAAQLIDKVERVFADLEK